MTRRLVIELEGGRIRTIDEVPDLEIVVFDWDHLSSEDATEEELTEAWMCAELLRHDHPDRRRILTALAVLLARHRARASGD
jgi:hypothetical protein